MAPSLRALFLAAVILCLSSQPGLAMFVGGTTGAQIFEPVEWPLTNYPCQKLPAEDAACLIDEIMRHMSANTLETQGDKWIFDQFVRSVAVWGTAAQKEQVFDSLAYIPQHLMQIEPEDLEYYEPETAKEKQQYQKMILLLSLGKIDMAVDFLKRAAQTTRMPKQNYNPRLPGRGMDLLLQKRGIDFLLETQTVDTAYDFAQKTADIFYIIPEDTPKPGKSFSHPLLRLLHQQIRTHGFASRLKVTKLFQGDNVYNWYSRDFNLDETLAFYAQQSKDPDAQIYHNKFCKGQVDVVAAHLKETSQKSAPSKSMNRANFIKAHRSLDKRECFKKYSEILLNFTDNTNTETPTFDTLQKKAQIYEDIKEAYTTAAPSPEKAPREALLKAYEQVELIPEEMVHISYFWAALHCPPETQSACIQKTSEEYRSHFLETIKRTSRKASFALINGDRLKNIESFITRFESTLRLNDFIDPKEFYASTSMESLRDASYALKQIQALSPPETSALYVRAFQKKIPPIDIFLTTPPDQISAQLSPWYEKTTSDFYIDTVLPHLDAARFDIVKDKLWQIYTQTCMSNPTRAMATASRLDVRYALCLQQALVRSAQ